MNIVKKLSLIDQNMSAVEEFNETYEEFRKTYDECLALIAEGLELEISNEEAVSNCVDIEKLSIQ